MSCTESIGNGVLHQNTTQFEHVVSSPLQRVPFSWAGGVPPELPVVCDSSRGISPGDGGAAVAGGVTVGLTGFEEAGFYVTPFLVGCPVRGVESESGWADHLVG